MQVSPNIIIKVKRCPLCGTRLVQQTDSSWLCPNCGYVEPAPGTVVTQ